MKGKWALIRLKGKPGETKDNWLLLKEKDEYANSLTGFHNLLPVFVRDGPWRKLNRVK